MRAASQSEEESTRGYQRHARHYRAKQAAGLPGNQQGGQCCHQIQVVPRKIKLALLDQQRGEQHS